MEAADLLRSGIRKPRLRAYPTALTIAEPSCTPDEAPGAAQARRDLQTPGRSGKPNVSKAGTCECAEGQLRPERSNGSSDSVAHALWTDRNQEVVRWEGRGTTSDFVVAPGPATLRYGDRRGAPRVDAVSDIVGGRSSYWAVVFTPRS